MRRLLFCSILLCACVSDRPRPDPTEAGGSADLVAYVRRPLNNATILGARPLKIEIQGTDVSRGSLTGIGYVVRRGPAKVDSLVVKFAATTDTTIDFDYTVPDLPTNTQLDFTAMAFGAHGEVYVSLASLTVVVKCQAGFPGC
jgi:hypothetical protein